MLMYVHTYVYTQLVESLSNMKFKEYINNNNNNINISNAYTCIYAKILIDFKLVDG